MTMLLYIAVAAAVVFMILITVPDNETHADVSWWR